MQLLDGKYVSEKLKQEIAVEAAEVLKNRGRKEKVLFESTQKGGKMFGYTGNYIKVEHLYNRDLIGKIVEVTI